MDAHNVTEGAFSLSSQQDRQDAGFSSLQEIVSLGAIAIAVNARVLLQASWHLALLNPRSTEGPMPTCTNEGLQPSVRKQDLQPVHAAVPFPSFQLVTSLASLGQLCA